MSIGPIEDRTVIQLMHLKRYHTEKIHQEREISLWRGKPISCTYRKWRNNFQLGCMALAGESRSEWLPVTDKVVTVKEVEDLILTDRRVTFQMIVQQKGFNAGSAWKYYQRRTTDDKGVSPLRSSCVYFVQEKNASWPFEMKTRPFLGNWRHLRSFDDLWRMLGLCAWSRDKKMIKKFKHGTSVLLKRRRCRSRYGRSMLSVFWIWRRIVITDCLDDGRIMISKHYCTLLKKLRDGLKQNRRKKAQERCFIRTDSAPAHSSWAAIEETTWCGH